MKILAVVVAYHPDVEALQCRLARYCDAVDRIFLWKNSPFELAGEKMVEAGDGTNRGIAYALNRAWQYARENGFDYLLTMDQDSEWEDFPAYLKAALDGPVGLYGPRVCPKSDAGAAVWQAGPEGAAAGHTGSQDTGGAGAVRYEPTDFLITSGMLIALPLLDEIGGWREDFSVDAVDVDFVLRAKSLGIPSFRVGAGVLWQQFGGRRKKCGFHIYDYSPERLYGIFRNHILTIRRYGSYAEPLRRMFVRRWLISRVPRILLGEKNRWAKFKAIIRGIRDGFRAPTGRRQVALVTWFGTPNYGTNLQAYALARALRREDVEPLLLRRFEYPFTLRALRENLHRLLGIRRFWKYGPDPWPEKTAAIRSFVREQLPSRMMVGPLGLRALSRKVSLFLCGSDQLWNVHDHFRSFEFLAFAPEGKKAAFATSTGNGSIPPELAERKKAYLTDFGPISLRENAGVQAISALTGRSDIACVLDPTFLLTPLAWRAFGAGAALNAKPGVRRDPLINCVRRGFGPDDAKPYLFCYLLRPGHEERVAEIARQCGLERIVSLPAGENPHPAIGTVIPDAGPREFVALLAGAAWVVTDSFHGFALSANLSRNVCVLKRFSDGDPASQNERMYDLAGRLGLEACLEEGPLPSIDWPVVQERIRVLRAESEQILKETLR